MDSTQAIIRLWRLCVQQPQGQQDVPDGAISVQVLKHVLQQELQGKEDMLGCRDVDDILEKYLKPDKDGVVGFLQFWAGMEHILQMCNTLRTGLSREKECALEGFRYLRQCIVDFANDTSQRRFVISVEELRYFINDGTMKAAGSLGAPFWRSQADSLPADDTLVTGEEVASALLAWLEELVGVAPAPEDADDFDGSSQTPSTSASTALQPQDLIDDDSFADGADVDAALLVGHQRPSPTQPYCDERMSFSNASEIGSYSLPLPPEPRGPPPLRSVLGGRPPHPARAADDARQNGSRKASELECGLVAVMRRQDTRRMESAPSKEEAAEWRDSMEFNAALRARLLDQPAPSQEFTFIEFYEMALSLVSSTTRRSSTRGVSPRVTSDCKKKGAQAFCVVLHDLARKRKAQGLCAWIAARRARKLSTCTGPPRPMGANDLFAELLRSQFQAAEVLEAKAARAGKTVFIALCMGRLASASMRPAWDQLMMVLAGNGRQAQSLGKSSTTRRSIPSPGVTGSPGLRNSGGPRMPWDARPDRSTQRRGSGSSPQASPQSSPLPSPQDTPNSQGRAGYPAARGGGTRRSREGASGLSQKAGSPHITR